MKRCNQCLVACVGLAAFASVSCEDDALAAKSAAQKAEIRTLELEVENLREEYGDKPEGDPVVELAEAEEELAATKVQVQTLEAEIAQLQAQREQVEEEFEEYKRKYRIED